MREIIKNGWIRKGCVACTISIKTVNRTDFNPVIKRMDWHLRHGGKALFLDFDRVLCDPDIANATSVLMLLEEFGMKPKNMAVKRFIDECSGIAAKKILLDLVPALCKEPELLDAMLARLAQIASRNVNLIKTTRISEDYLPGVRQRQGDVRIAVLTNRDKIAIHPALDQLGMRNIFDIVLYQSSIMPAKPAPDMLKWGLKLTGALPSQALLIDDNRECINAAVTCGIPAKRLMWKIDGGRYSLRAMMGGRP